MTAGFVLTQRLSSKSKDQMARSFGQPAASVIDELKQGYRTVRASSLLSWMFIAAVLFAILYYSLVFPFARAVSSEFPDEASVAAFLGTFQEIATAIAVGASLIFTNRLYSRFGFMTTILVYPVIYLVGFSALLIKANFAALVVFRLVQIFWSEGVSEGANQAMYNVVAPENREKARTFIRGVANQFGVFLAGLLLLLGERIISSDYLYVVGVVVAAFTTYFVWRARGTYASAIVSTLKAGQSHIFFS